MKKYREGDFWFELVIGTDPNGQRGVRYYRVSCRKCSNSSSYHASGTSNEGLKKIFTRAGWTIGKSRFKHFCPACTQRQAITSSPRSTPAHSTPPSATLHSSPPAPPSPPTASPSFAHHTAPHPIHIQEVWAHLSDDERVEFWHWLHDTYACWLDNSGRISLIPAPAPAVPPPSAEIIPLRPSEPPSPDLLPPSSSEPAPSDDDDDDVADWWKELTARKKESEK